MTLTETIPNQSTGESEGTTKELDPLTWFYGIDNIARYMSWGKLKVLRMNQKHNFPLLRMPTPERHHWQYATNTLLILIWMQSMAEDAYQHVARTAFGRKLRATRGAPPVASTAQQAPDPPQPPSDSPTQPLDITTTPDHV